MRFNGRTWIRDKAGITYGGFAEKLTNKLQDWGSEPSTEWTYELFVEGPRELLI